MATNKQGENYSLNDREKKAFTKEHPIKSDVTVENFQAFVKEQQEEFLMRALGSPRYDEAQISRNTKIKKSWDELNAELNIFAQDFELVKASSEEIIKQTTQDLTQLKHNIEELQGNEWAKKLGDISGDSELKLSPELEEYYRKTGVARFLFGSHKNKKFKKAMKSDDGIMEMGDRQLLSVVGVQISQAYLSATKILGNDKVSGEQMVKDNIAKYYTNMYPEETFDINSSDQVKKLQSQLMLMPDQIDNVFITGKLHSDFTKTETTKNTEKTDLTNADSITAYLSQSGLDGSEMKQGALHLAGLFADLSSGNASQFTGPVLEAVMQATGVAALKTLNRNRGNLSIYPTLVGRTPGVAVMVNVAGTGDARVTASANVGVMISPLGIDYLVGGGVTGDVSSHKKFDGRGEKNLSLGGYAMFDNKFVPKSAGAALMFLSNKAEGIQNDVDLFKSAMGAHMNTLYEAYTSDTSTDQAPKLKAVTDALMGLGRSDGIKLKRQEAEKFAGQITPLFGQIAAQKLGNSQPLLDQVVDRYAQLWKNDQVLQAKSFGLTGIGIGAIVTRFATYAVPTIRFTSRKVVFGADKELINQQVKLAQAGKGGIELAENQNGLADVAKKYNTILKDYGLEFSPIMGSSNFKLSYNETKPGLKLLIKKGTITKENDIVTLPLSTPSALIEKIGKNSASYVLVLGDNKLHTGDSEYVEYKTEITQEELGNVDIATSTQSNAGRGITTIKPGGENSIEGYEISVDANNIVFSPTEANNIQGVTKFTLDEFKAQGVSYLKNEPIPTFVLGGSANQLTIKNTGDVKNKEVIPFTLESYAKNPKFYSREFKFAALNLKNSGNPKDKAENLVFRKQLNTFAQLINNSEIDQAIVLANIILSQIKSRTTKLKDIKLIESINELYDFNEALSLTWRSYDRQFNQARYSPGTVLTDITKQKSEVIKRVLQEKDSSNNSVVDRDIFNNELDTVLGSIALNDKKIITQEDYVESKNSIGFVFGTILDGDQGLDEKLVASSYYLKGTQKDISDKPQMKKYLTNTLISNANKNTSTNTIYQINQILKSQNAPEADESTITNQLQEYANSGESKPLQFGKVKIRPRSNFEVHPGCINYRMSISFDVSGVSISQDDTIIPLLDETKPVVTPAKTSAKYYSVIDSFNADLKEKQTVVGIAVGNKTKGITQIDDKEKETPATTVIEGVKETPATTVIEGTGTDGVANPKAGEAPVTGPGGADLGGDGVGAGEAPVTGPGADLGGNGNGAVDGGGNPKAPETPVVNPGADLEGGKPFERIDGRGYIATVWNNVTRGGKTREQAQLSRAERKAARQERRNPATTTNTVPANPTEVVTPANPTEVVTPANPTEVLDLNKIITIKNGLVTKYGSDEDGRKVLTTSVAGKVTKNDEIYVSDSMLGYDPLYKIYSENGVAMYQLQTFDSSNPNTINRNPKLSEEQFKNMLLKTVSRYDYRKSGIVEKGQIRRTNFDTNINKVTPLINQIPLSKDDEYNVTGSFEDDNNGEVAEVVSPVTNTNQLETVKNKILITEAKNKLLEKYGTEKAGKKLLNEGLFVSSQYDRLVLSLGSNKGADAAYKIIIDSGEIKYLLLNFIDHSQNRENYSIEDNPKLTQSQFEEVVRNTKSRYEIDRLYGEGSKGVSSGVDTTNSNRTQTVTDKPLVKSNDNKVASNSRENTALGSDPLPKITIGSEGIKQENKNEQTIAGEDIIITPEQPLSITDPINLLSPQNRSNFEQKTMDGINYPYVIDRENNMITYATTVEGARTNTTYVITINQDGDVTNVKTREKDQIVEVDPQSTLARSIVATSVKDSLQEILSNSIK